MGKRIKRFGAFALCLLILVSMMPEAAYASSGSSSGSSGVEYVKKTYSKTATIVTENEDAADADEDEVVLVSTTTTYKVSFTVWTKAASSSDDTLKFLKISKPKVKKTVVKTYSDGKTKTSTSTKTYSLTVKCNVAGEGWTKAAVNDAGTAYKFTAGTGERIQAVKITLSDSFRKVLKQAGLSIYYRGKSESFGTLGWAKTGQTAGTIGNSSDLTKFTMKIVTAEEAAELDTENHYISKPVVSYTTKLTGGSSYSTTVKNGSTSGSKTSGESIGTVKISLDSDYSFSGSIKYSIRTSKTDSSENWSDYVKNGAKAGSKNSKIKAIRIKLTGDMADNYDVYYRVYVNGYGWLGWAKNGEKAGTKNLSYNISAIQVKLVVKGQDGPESTTNHYISSIYTGAKKTMYDKAQSYSSSTKYLILVDRANCKVGIFTGSKGNWKFKYYWDCCVGKSSTPTVSGSFTVSGKGYSFGTSSYTCYYYTQFYGNYLFHSVLYYPGQGTSSSAIKDGTMGQAVSHGCVRLTLSHAKWIYNNIPYGTKVYIY